MLFRHTAFSYPIVYPNLRPIKREVSINWVSIGRWLDSDPELGISRHHRRRVSVAVSSDLVHWNEIRSVFFPDERDPDWPDIDHFRPFFQGGLFLGFSAYVDPTGYMRGQPRAAWSHDGFHWHQPPGMVQAKFYKIGRTPSVTSESSIGRHPIHMRDHCAGEQVTLHEVTHSWRSPLNAGKVMNLIRRK